MDVLAGMDFFTVEVLTWIIPMEQMARNPTLEELGCLHRCRYLLHDRDTKC